MLAERRFWKFENLWYVIFITDEYHPCCLKSLQNENKNSVSIVLQCPHCDVPVVKKPGNMTDTIDMVNQARETCTETIINTKNIQVLFLIPSDLKIDAAGSCLFPFVFLYSFILRIKQSLESNKVSKNTMLEYTRTFVLRIKLTVQINIFCIFVTIYGPILSSKSSEKWCQMQNCHQQVIFDPSRFQITDK